MGPHQWWQWRRDLDAKERSASDPNWTLDYFRSSWYLARQLDSQSDMTSVWTFLQTFWLALRESQLL
jgi:hypothetical protein